ncbi:hypothetical protein [Epiphyas postvittana nucleopolyhedrovirus]|uniref:Uncharacterized protein n=1 Tax=Epiphyas postvittana nucleopolyhedrovirus TaxID=70600 RepID=Q91GM5_NPVEP|nr:hypothetical protein [Epiphyas postvittana nucleopolyhedrovirus]AAK85588.1 unknown [Epiphyas postvittana nucleopolyhedrovirus]
MASALTTAPAYKQDKSLRQQIVMLTQARAKRNYERDLGQLVKEIKKRGVTNGHLGDVLEIMGKQSQLLTEMQKNDDEFRIVQQRDLSQNTIDYLNCLQNEKLFHCKLCYSHADWLWCEFHKTHAYRGSRDVNVDAYVEHINSDMGIVSFVEEYYHYLSSNDGKLEAKRVLKTLTNFESLNELLASHNYSAQDADTSVYELMDFD